MLPKSTSLPATIGSQGSFRAIAPRTQPFVADPASPETPKPTSKKRKQSADSDEHPPAKRRRRPAGELPLSAFCPVCYSGFAEVASRNKHIGKPICTTHAKARQLPIPKPTSLESLRSSERLEHLKVSLERITAEQERTRKALPLAGPSRRGRSNGGVPPPTLSPNLNRPQLALQPEGLRQSVPYHLHPHDAPTLSRSTSWIQPQSVHRVHTPLQASASFGGYDGLSYTSGVSSPAVAYPRAPAQIQASASFGGYDTAPRASFPTQQLPYQAPAQIQASASFGGYATASRVSCPTQQQPYPAPAQIQASASFGGYDAVYNTDGLSSPAFATYQRSYPQVPPQLQAAASFGDDAAYGTSSMSSPTYQQHNYRARAQLQGSMSLGGYGPAAATFHTPQPYQASNSYMMAEDSAALQAQVMPQQTFSPASFSSGTHGWGEQSDVFSNPLDQAAAARAQAVSASYAPKKVSTGRQPRPSRAWNVYVPGDGKITPLAPSQPERRSSSVSSGHDSQDRELVSPPDLYAGNAGNYDQVGSSLDGYAAASPTSPASPFRSQQESTSDAPGTPQISDAEPSVPPGLESEDAPGAADDEHNELFHELFDAASHDDETAEESAETLVDAAGPVEEATENQEERDPTLLADLMSFIDSGSSSDLSTPEFTMSTPESTTSAWESSQPDSELETPFSLRLADIYKQLFSLGGV